MLYGAARRPARQRGARHRPESVAESLRGLLAVLADADVRRIMAMATCVIAPFMCVGGLWAGPYLQVVHGLDPAEASWVLLAMITTANVGTFVYGPLDRRFGGRRKVVLAGAVATMIMLAALALWPAPASGSRSQCCCCCRR